MIINFAKITTTIMKGGNCFMNSKLIKILGIAATAIGMAATLVTDWVNDKKTDEKIEQKVNEAFAKREEKGS
jgi:hypothetical protein